MFVLFPPVELADKDGLLGFGGNLLPETLLNAYSSGIFFWTCQPITWWAPDPRAIIEIDNFSLNKRMMRYYKNTDLVFTFDKDFLGVVESCAEPTQSRPTTWIAAQFIDAYAKLHELGFAHSVEAWLHNKLVGGVFGVAIGGFFAGDSMFSRVSNASTLALYHLITHLNKKEYQLFDIQVISEHTLRLGAIEIPRTDYMQRLKKAINKKCNF